MDALTWVILIAVVAIVVLLLVAVMLRSRRKGTVLAARDPKDVRS